MTENQKFVELIAANPGLPIVVMVNGDVTEGEGMYWMAGISHVEVAEVGLVGERYYDSREDFKEAYYERYDDELTERFNYNPTIGTWGNYTKEVIEANDKADAELDAYLEERANEYMKKCIVVYVDEPDLTDWRNA